MKKLIFILCLAPSIALSATDKELAYLEMLNYRLNMMASSNEMATTLNEILTELRLIRCKIETTESDCRDILPDSEDK
jgi:hypothetical protein